MNYVMRSIYKDDFELIQNLNFKLPFPIDQDFYLSDEFQAILQGDSDWWSSLEEYYYRPEYELYNISSSDEPFEARPEKINLVQFDEFQNLFEEMKSLLKKWQWETQDPWRCAPRAILQDSGRYKDDPSCFPLHNEL